LAYAVVCPSLSHCPVPVPYPYLTHSFLFSMIPPPPRSTLFPYTTLFRSDVVPRSMPCLAPLPTLQRKANAAPPVLFGRRRARPLSLRLAIELNKSPRARGTPGRRAPH